MVDDHALKEEFSAFIKAAKLNVSLNKIKNEHFLNYNMGT